MTLINSCATLSQSGDFCASYQEVIQKQGDGTITADPNVKKRIAANEVNYKCNCLKVKADYCKLGN